MASKDLSRGILITFEGPEGSGKSTQVRMLCNYLRGLKLSVWQLREPGGTVISEQIRRILLDPKNKNMELLCEMLLYQAARAQLVNEKILPALKAKKVVVLDRFLDATICYQGYGSGLDTAVIKRIGCLVTSGIQPDLTILLDIAAKNGLRKCKSRDRIERKSLQFHRRVRRGYLKLAGRHPRRIKIVSLAREIAQTHAIIKSIVGNLLQSGTRFK